MAKRKKVPEFDMEQINAYRALSAREKLRFLEEMNRFFRKAMPAAGKKAWEKLRAKGW